jgi:hypothetical protein
MNNEIRKLPQTSQLQAFLNSGMSVDLYLSPRTPITRPLHDNVLATGGNVFVRICEYNYMDFIL